MLGSVEGEVDDVVPVAVRVLLGREAGLDDRAHPREHCGVNGLEVPVEGHQMCSQVAQLRASVS